MASNPFKIVRFRCGGIDIHKNFIVCAASCTDLKTLETTFDTSQYTCLITADCRDVCIRIRQRQSHHSRPSWLE